MTVRIHFRDLPHSNVIKEGCERLANSLKEEFPETSKFEVSMNHNGEQHETHVYVTGKDLEVASSANDHELQESIAEAFERVRRQLRKHHDKLIHTRRRGASRTERS
jgi:ribosomal subunit interface protein